MPGVIGVVGVGAIAEAIVTGLCEGEGASPTIRLSPRSEERSSRLAGRYESVQVADSNQGAVDGADAVLICVRPPDAEAVLSELAFAPEQTVITAVADFEIAKVQALVGPVEAIVRVVPLPAVARRQGLTVIHPADGAAEGIFEPLGGCVVVERESEVEILSIPTATLAAHFAYLDTITRWVAERGIPEAEAAAYVAATFAGLAGSLGDAGFGDLAAEYATPGGFNEQFLASVREAGIYDAVERALDELERRLQSG